MSAQGLASRRWRMEGGHLKQGEGPSTRCEAVTTVCHTEPFSQGAQSLGRWVGSPRAAAVGGGQLQRGGYKVKAQERAWNPSAGGGRGHGEGGMISDRITLEETKPWTPLGLSPAHHPLTAGQARCFTSVSLSVFICKMETIKPILCAVEAERVHRSP